MKLVLSYVLLKKKNKWEETFGPPCIFVTWEDRCLSITQDWCFKCISEITVICITLVVRVINPQLTCSLIGSSIVIFDDT